MKLKKTLQAIAVLWRKGSAAHNASVMLFDDAGDVSSILYSATTRSATLSRDEQFTLNSLTAANGLRVRISERLHRPGE